MTPNSTSLQGGSPTSPALPSPSHCHLSMGFCNCLLTGLPAPLYCQALFGVCNDSPVAQSKSRSPACGPVAPTALLTPVLPLSPIHSTPTTLASAVLRTARARSHLRAFALAVPLAWDIRPPESRIISLLCPSGVCSNTLSARPSLTGHVK